MLYFSFDFYFNLIFYVFLKFMEEDLNLNSFVRFCGVVMYSSSILFYFILCNYGCLILKFYFL